jgi:hypothetical protein
MPLKVTISNITGATPFHIYICEVDGTSCFYINTITSTELPYQFDIPQPYDVNTQYMINAVDANNCNITGTTTVI